MSLFRKGILAALTVMVTLLSIPPVVNMISPNQMMNVSFNPLHLVNTYGAFGSVTRERNEIILEGTREGELGPATKWKAYEFKCKPGDLDRRPCVVSPYHLRLDWLMWFAAMADYRSYPWILNLEAKLLQNDRATLKLLAKNPFPDEPPRYLRAELYRYRFTDPEEKKQTGRTWKRTRVGPYLPPLSLDHSGFLEILSDQGWLE